MPILARSPGPLKGQNFRMTRGIAIPLLAVFRLRDRLVAEPAELERLSRLGLGAESASAAPKSELIAPALRRIRWDLPEEPAVRLVRLTKAFEKAQSEARDCGLLASEAPVEPLLRALVEDLPSRR